MNWDALVRVEESCLEEHHSGRGGSISKLWRPTLRYQPASAGCLTAAACIQIDGYIDITALDLCVYSTPCWYHRWVSKVPLHMTPAMGVPNIYQETGLWSQREKQNKKKQTQALTCIQGQSQSQVS